MTAISPLEATLVDGTSLRDALMLGARLLGKTHDGVVRLGAALLTGPAVVLGARQHGPRVLDLAAARAQGVTVARRHSTGTAAWIGRRAVLWCLCLPHVAALMSDATPRTLLNRNVRPMLQALTRCGVLSHYFGRETLNAGQRPLVLLGYELCTDGRVLIEMIAGCEAPIALPTTLQSHAELALDRWRGRAPVALLDCTPSADDLPRFATRVLEQVAARIDRPLRWCGPPSLASDESVAWVPDEATVVARVSAPIGYVEAARTGTGVWLGGDALTSTAWLDAAAQALLANEVLPPASALDGARPDDFVRAWRATSGNQE